MSVQIRGRQILDGTISSAKLALGDAYSFSGAVSVPTPTADGHAANKGYVDGLLQGLHPKESCRVITKVNVDISSAPAAIDGVTMASGDRVVLTNQTTNTQNGIYKYAGSGNAMGRTSDADTFAKLQSAYFFVKEGTSADEGFVQTAELTSFAAQNYIQFSSAGNIDAGAGLAKAGNVLSVVVDDSSIQITGDSLNVKAGGITNAMMANSAITIAGASTALGGAITADTIAGQIGSGVLANAQLANSSVSFGGISLALGVSDATPAFDLTDAINYPTSSLSGTISNAQLTGSIENGKLQNSSVSLGGVSVSLGGTDSTPAFDLQDSTGYLSSALVGSVANSQLANKAITIAGASTELGGSITAAAILGASDTDALSEGSTNQYFTAARAQAAISVADSTELDLSMSSGQISGALNADSVELSKVGYEGYFDSFTADGSTKEFLMTKTIKLSLVKSFSVAVNGLLMDYNASPSSQDAYFIDNGGAGGKGRCKFGVNLNNGDVVTLRYIA